MATYLTRADIDAAIPADVLLEAADLDRDGVEDPGVVDKALDDAQAEVDSYLLTRYPVPVSPVPTRLRQVSVAICVYRLLARRGLDEDGPDKVIVRDYNDAIRWLRDVGAGRAAVPVVGGDPEPTPTVIHSRTRQQGFTGGGLDGFG
jgi:phage gp36-like protein